MSTPSEDNQLDQSLRDVFRDYDLPPDAHPRVWEGVAERIAALPAPNKGLPYRFLLPLTAAIGVGVGWLLPHPAAQPASELATPVRQAVQYAPASSLAPVAAPLLAVPEAPAVEAQAMEAPTVSQSAVPALPVARKSRPAAQARPALSSQPGAVAPAPDSLGLAAQAIVTPEVMVPTNSASAAAPALVPLTATPPASAAASSAAPAKSSKPTGSHEKIGYRKLMQRQPEGRRGIGRWVTRFFQGVRHLLG